MFTYIKHDVRGYYVELPEMLTEDLYSNLGTTWDDFVDNKWVLLSEEQVKFHQENPKAKVSEVWTMVLDPVHVRNINDAKNEMKSRIERYDDSEEVNQFIINGVITGWFTPSERSNYKSSIDAAKLVGLETLTFFVGNNMMEITPTVAEQLLAQIQLYADQCFIVTKQHKLNVDALETMEEVDAYNYKQGYPEKLNFKLA